jgi:hypothetical protein
VPFSLYVNDIPASFRHAEQAQYADDTALTATSRSPPLLIAKLEAYLGRLKLWYGTGGLSSRLLRAPLCSLKDREKQPKLQISAASRAASIVSRNRYFGATFDTQLTWSTHVKQVGKKSAKRLGVLGLVLNRRSGLSVTKGVQL